MTHASMLSPGGCSLATFYSRSRKGRWCKGETSGHFIQVGALQQCSTALHSLPAAYSQ